MSKTHRPVTVRPGTNQGTRPKGAQINCTFEPFGAQSSFHRAPVLHHNRPIYSHLRFLKQATLLIRLGGPTGTTKGGVIAAFSQAHIRRDSFFFIRFSAALHLCISASGLIWAELNFTWRFIAHSFLPSLSPKLQLLARDLVVGILWSFLVFPLN